MDADTGQRFLIVPELPAVLERGAIVDVDQCGKWVVVSLWSDSAERTITVGLRQ